MILWEEWTPGLDNDSCTLREIYSLLPGNEANEISWIVKLLENPSSPVALAGAIDLFGHDCLHILLGRGLLNQDEAFVIGFTMQCASSFKERDAKIFECVGRLIYKAQYKLRDNDVLAYSIGRSYGRMSKIQDIHKVDFKALMDKKLGDIRQLLGIDTEMLQYVYQVEKDKISDTKESLRLPIFSLVL